jgi:hypothetical protein
MYVGNVRRGSRGSLLCQGSGGELPRCCNTARGVVCVTNTSFIQRRLEPLTELNLPVPRF